MDRKRHSMQCIREDPTADPAWQKITKSHREVEPLCWVISGTNIKSDLNIVNLRGLDVKGVSAVVNYDLANNTEDYVHR